MTDQFTKHDDAGTPEEARQLLAPLYGEAPALSPGEAAEFEGTRDALHDFLADAPRSSKLRDAVLAAATIPVETSSVKLHPMGQVWVRRSRRGQPMPVTGPCDVLPGSMVQTGGGRAAIQFADGSRLALRYGTTVEVGAIAADRDAARLVQGRLYAKVRPQSSGRFAIGTSMGRVAVVGTEFDLAAEGPDSVRLLVTKGEVSYERGGGAALEQRAVRVNQLLESRKEGITMKTISAGAARRETKWAGEEKAGGGMGKFALAMGAVILAVGAGIWYLKGETSQSTSTPLTPGAGGSPTSVAGGAVPSSDSVHVPYFLPAGTEFRLIGTGETNAGGRWVLASETTWRCRVLESDPALGVTVAARLEKHVPKILTERKFPESLRDKEIIVKFGQKGNLTSLSGCDYLRQDGNVDGNPLIFGLEVANLLTMFFGPGASVAMGEEIAVATSTTLPVNPPLSYELNTVSRFEKLDDKDGRKLAQFQDVSTVKYNNIVIQGTIASGAGKLVTVREILAKATGRTLMDPATGWRTYTDGTLNLHLEIVTQFTKDGKITAEIPIPIPDTESRFTGTVEYLP